MVDVQSRNSPRVLGGKSSNCKFLMITDHYFYHEIGEEEMSGPSFNLSVL